MEDFLRALFGDDVENIHIVQVDARLLQAHAFMREIISITNALGRMTKVCTGIYDAIMADEDLKELACIDPKALASFITNTYNMRIKMVERVLATPEDGIPEELLKEQVEVMKDLRQDRDEFFYRSAKP